MCHRLSAVIGILLLEGVTPLYAECPPIVEFHISIDRLAYTGRPFWIKADFKPPFTVQYPCGLGPASYPYLYPPDYFGESKLEVKRGSQTLTPRFSCCGAMVNGAPMRPAGVHRNRLPLHLQYPLTQAGMYSVRWSQSQQTTSRNIITRSNWIIFEVKDLTSKDRENWLRKQLASVPAEPMVLVGDYLPSLLAAAPDRRVLNTILRQLYSKDRLVCDYALGSLALFPGIDVRAQMIELLRSQGPCHSIAEAVQWYPGYFKIEGDDFIKTVLPYLSATDDKKVLASLELLCCLRGNASHLDAITLRQADEAVLRTAPRLIRKAEARQYFLAQYLAYPKNDKSRKFLQELIEQPDSYRQSAVMSLAKHADARDLPLLGNLLLHHGQSYQLFDLPAQLLRSFGEPCLSYLEQTLSKSSEFSIQRAIAEELMTKERPFVWEFLAGQIKDNKVNTGYWIKWLGRRFPKTLSSNPSDLELIGFFKFHGRDQ